MAIFKSGTQNTNINTVYTRCIAYIVKHFIALADDVMRKVLQLKRLRPKAINQKLLINHYWSHIYAYINTVICAFFSAVEIIYLFYTSISSMQNVISHGNF